MNIARPNDWTPTTRSQASSGYAGWPNTVSSTNRGATASEIPTSAHTPACRYSVRLRVAMASGTILGLQWGAVGR